MTRSRIARRSVPVGAGKSAKARPSAAVGVKTPSGTRRWKWTLSVEGACLRQQH
jgi:hypothetical protein